MTGVVLTLILLHQAAPLAILAASLLTAAVATVPSLAPWRPGPERNSVTATNASNAMQVNPELNGSAAPQIVALHSVPDAPEPERKEAFSINGTVYSINVKPKANTALKYVHLARTRGNEIAIDFMLETLLGKEGYEALIEFDDLTEDDLEQVITAASKIMAGALETPKEKPRRGSRKSAG